MKVIVDKTNNVLRVVYAFYVCSTFFLFYQSVFYEALFHNSIYFCTALCFYVAITSTVDFCFCCLLQIDWSKFSITLHMHDTNYSKPSEEWTHAWGQAVCLHAIQR